MHVLDGGCVPGADGTYAPPLIDRIQGLGFGGLAFDFGEIHMGGCQHYGPFWGTLDIRGRIIIGTQKGTIILTIPHIPHT